MQTIIQNFFQSNFKKPPSRIAVAVSGGCDSMALVFAINEFSCKNQINLLAVTVDHKMRKDSSKEAREIGKILRAHKIKHEILEIDEAPQKNVEANLREARYSRLYDFCLSSKVDNLFLGHHQGDVAENFLIRLFRGSQIDGLAAMQTVTQFKKIKLCRPFLDVTKEELQDYLKARKIKWFEDESNEDEKFLRNKIRKFFAQFEEKNLIQKRIKTAAENIAQTKEMLDEVLLKEAATCLAFQPEGNFVIDIEKYKKIPPKIAQKILSLVLLEVSGDVYKPRLAGLQNFEKNILSLPKGKKKNFYGCMAVGVQNFEPAPKRAVLIYRDPTHPQNPTQNFDQNTLLIDGRFMVKQNSQNKSSGKKFHFRTILGKIFEK